MLKGQSISGKPVKVVRLVPELNFGGVETGIGVQAELFDRSRFDLRVCTFWRDGAAAQEVRERGVQVDVLGVNPSIYSARASLALARYLRRIRPDVLHASVTEADFHAALLAPLRLARRTIIDEAGFPEKARLRRRLSFRLLNRMVDDIVVVSEGLGDFLVEREGAPRRKIRFIPNCGKAHFFEEPKTDYSMTPEGLQIGVVGRLVDVKNHVVLLEALALMGTDERPHVHVLGGGPLEGQLKAKAEMMGVADHFHIYGFVESTGAILRRMDGYAIPSHAEGCSLALIEAMALGLPVIASAVQGNAEVVAPLGSDWMIAPNDAPGWADALRRLARLPLDARRERGEAARRRAIERYSPEAYSAALERLYVRTGDSGRGAA